MLRGFVSSTNAVMTTAMNPPAIMPLRGTPPVSSATSPGKITPLSKPVPIQNDTPTMSPLR